MNWRICAIAFDLAALFSNSKKICCNDIFHYVKDEGGACNIQFRSKQLSSNKCAVFKEKFKTKNISTKLDFLKTLRPFQKILAYIIHIISGPRSCCSEFHAK